MFNLKLYHYVLKCATRTALERVQYIQIYLLVVLTAHEYYNLALMVLIVNEEQFHKTK